MSATAWKLVPEVPTREMLKAFRHAINMNPYCIGRNHVHRDGRQWEFSERVDYENRPDADEFTVLERFATEDEVRAHYGLMVDTYAYQAMLMAAPAAPTR